MPPDLVREQVPELCATMKNPHNMQDIHGIILRGVIPYLVGKKNRLRPDVPARERSTGNPNERPRPIFVTMKNPYHMQDIHGTIFQW